MSKDVLLLVSTMLLAGLAALRYETGGDWDTYAKIYADLPRLAQIMHDPSLLKNESAEPLFVLLCSALRELTKDMQLLFAVVAVFDLSSIAILALCAAVGLISYTVSRRREAK